MAAELEAGDFAAFFEAVNGVRPHPWQERLASLVLAEGRWPEVLDLPTGAGKTAVVEIALFALAASPHRFPRRIVFVVDRRLIVDQVGERVSRIQDCLRSSNSRAAGEVAQRLRSIGASIGGEETIVGASTLRGGRAERAWAARPDLPWVIVSTVDQVGSRLLFRGYGVSERMQPIHAGLLGNDCLFFLDEVHISRPFVETLAAIGANYRTGASRPWQVVSMSATPGLTGRTFGLDDNDCDGEQSPMLSRILGARKNGQLLVVGKPREPEDAALPKAVLDLLPTMADADSVGVIVNRVATAVAVAQALTRSDAPAVLAPLLLTGRMRPWDRRQCLEDERFARLKAGTARERRAERVVLVSTQSIEVGADLDLGAMITEIAPIDALRQRFGRVDRRGSRSAEAAPAPIVVLATQRSLDPRHGDDPIYGVAPQKTWEWLADRSTDGTLDLGITSPAVSDPPPPDALAPTPQAPLLLPSHLDNFVQTNPPPRYGAPPSLWLHGTDESDSDVQVVWRADITESWLRSRTDVGEAVGALLAAKPPHEDERLPVPLGALVRWLRGATPADVADVDHTSGEVATAAGQRPHLVVRWTVERSAIIDDPQDVRPGDVLVVPSNYGGLWDGTWAPGSCDPVQDIGDLVDDAVLRLLEPLPATLQQDVVEGVVTAADAYRQWLGTASEEQIAALIEPLRRVVDADRAALAPDSIGAKVDLVETAHGPRLFLRTRRQRVDAEALDASDEVNSMTGAAVPLGSHLRGVGALARAFGEHCGVGAPLAADLDLAGRLHDAGKLDPRFQLILHDGDELRAALAEEPLAKSATHWRNRRRQSPANPGLRYPPGARHELMSAAIIDQYPQLIAEANDPDLVRYLISSHHGYCRPFAPPQLDPFPVTVKGEIEGTVIEASSAVPPPVHDIRAADLFWRLVRRYGWYGLAWIEAIFRLADHRRSELEQLQQEQYTDG